MKLFTPNEDFFQEVFIARESGSIVNTNKNEANTNGNPGKYRPPLPKVNTVNRPDTKRGLIIEVTADKLLKTP